MNLVTDDHSKVAPKRPTGELLAGWNDAVLMLLWRVHEVAMTLAVEFARI